MFSKIHKFWDAFIRAFKEAYHKVVKRPTEALVQKYRNIDVLNLLGVCGNKLVNLACVEATFDLISDSILTDKLSALCKDLQGKRYEIGIEAVCVGDYWVFPYHNKSGELKHQYLTQDKVTIIEMDGEKEIDIVGIIDSYVDDKNNTYFLNRRHTLAEQGLYIDTYITNDRNERVLLEQWQDGVGTYLYPGIKHIGVGRFKSPVSSRGHETIYGVPLNFPCHEIEEKILNDLQMIEKEFKNGESKIFADPLILRMGKDKVGQDSWQIPENVFPIDTRGGTASATMDIFAPGFRYEGALKSKLLDDMMLYEQTMGLDKGFLTPFDNGSYTNTAQVRRENANTISMIDKLHTMYQQGVDMTLEADAIFLNLVTEYSVKYDWVDPFEDMDKQYERIANGVDRGTAEPSDEIRWLFPDLTQEEIADKLARISAQAQTNTDQALERILAGQ